MWPPQRNADGRRPADPPPAPPASLQCSHVADALPALEQREVGLHFLRALVAALLRSFARPEHDFMKLQRLRARCFGKPFRRHLRELFWQAASGAFVKNHAERVKVGGG